MRSFHSICFVGILFICSKNVFSEDLAKDLSIDSIAPKLMLVSHSYPWQSNSLVAEMENGEILLVDVPYTPAATDSVLSWISQKYGKRNIIAVNTHFHVDRLGGNAALVRKGIPVYSSELTINAIKTLGKKSLSLLSSWISDEQIKNYYTNFVYVPPTDIFDSKLGLTLRFGKELVYVKFHGVGHSVDNLTVYLPTKKVIFGGCMILPMAANQPGNVADGNKMEWLKTLRLIDTTNYNLIIPGHGKLGGLELISHTAYVLNK